MKNKYLLTLLSVSLSAQAVTAATTYLVDFNDAESGSYPDGSWNTFNDPADINGSTLVDSGGGASGIALSLVGTDTNSGDVNYIGDDTTLRLSGNSGSNVYTVSATSPLRAAGPSWVVNGAADTAAAADYFYTDTNSLAHYTMTLTGLTANSDVSLDLWLSRENVTSGNGFYDYSLDGVTWTGFTVLKSDGSLETADSWDTNTTALSGGQVYESKADGNIAGRYMSTQTITLTGSTTLYFRGTDATSGNWASAGAVRLTVIPEPETYALLAGICGLTYVMLRRRS